MKIPFVLLLALLPAFAWADSAPVPLGPNNGRYGDWTAAAYGTGVAKTCYAFTTLAQDAADMLTVTERAGARDEVTVTAAAAFAPTARVGLMLGKKHFKFYVQGNTAFTEYGQALVAALPAETKAVVRIGNGDTAKLEKFSLVGFSGAFHAIQAACP